jgi:hypothetical protein
MKIVFRVNLPNEMSWCASWKNIPRVGDIVHASHLCTKVNMETFLVDEVAWDHSGEFVEIWLTAQNLDTEEIHFRNEEYLVRIGWRYSEGRNARLIWEDCHTKINENSDFLKQPKRICANPECGTFLSSYNPSKFCHIHKPSSHPCAPVDDEDDFDDYRDYSDYGELYGDE